jgi:hypothetical protein
MTAGLSHSAVLRFGALALMAAAGYTLYTLSQKRDKQRRQTELLQVLSLYRHEWMNHIQVLMGYIGLGKPERIQEYMGKIKAKVHQESCLSKLGVPELALYYYTFQMHHRSLALELELEQEITLEHLPDSGAQAGKLIIALVELFATEALPDSEQHNALSLSFDQEQAGILLDFIYEGSLSPHFDAKLSELSRRYGVGGQQMEHERTEEGLGLAVRLPFDTK